MRNYFDIRVQIFQSSDPNKIAIAHDTEKNLKFDGKADDNRTFFTVRRSDENFPDKFSLESVAFPGNYVGLGSQGARLRGHIRGDEKLIWLGASI